MCNNNGDDIRYDHHCLDGYEPLPRFERTCCVRCKHFHGVIQGTCKAFPSGIPDKYAIRNANGWMKMHYLIEDDQEGTVTFELDDAYGNNI